MLMEGNKHLDLHSVELADLPACDSVCTRFIFGWTKGLKDI